MQPTVDVEVRGATLGKHLANLRAAAGLTLRQVEEATEREVSNAYLSQLETGKISKPSPNILHALALAYNTPYQNLMELAGYVTAAPQRESATRHGRVAALSIDNLTPEEEAQILEYVAFVRSKRKRT
jgi:HTH-type transcriptional regulator, competence development regulator